VHATHVTTGDAASKIDGRVQGLDAKVRRGPVWTGWLEIGCQWTDPHSSGLGMYIRKTMSIERPGPVDDQRRRHSNKLQIKALDDELRKYQAQIKKSKGPAQASLKRRAIDVRTVTYRTVFAVWRD